MSETARTSYFINSSAGKLGKNGGFDVRFSDGPGENCVFAGGKSKKVCLKLIEDLEKLLIKKGYADHEHIWEVILETDYGEMDYSSFGGGVERFVVTLCRCRLCGDLRKESRGDLCGDVCVRWFRRYGKLVLHVSVPFGTEADVVFDGRTRTVGSGFRVFEKEL